MTLGDKIAVMKVGVVQQCGTPVEVYNRSVNSLVANFMGWPPMNVIPVTLAVNDGVLRAELSVGRGLDASTTYFARSPFLG